MPLGRKRRCGWLDLPLVKYSARVNGITNIALTKLDVLTGLDPVNLCIAYESQGKIVESVPAKLSTLNSCTPVYEEMDGWDENVSGARTFDELPSNTRAYIKRIEEFIEVPVSIISVGPGRDETIICKNPFNNK